VERVTLPIIIETVELVAVVVAHEGRFGRRRRARGFPLIDIVAVMIDEIEVGFLADMAPRREEPAFVMLASGDRDPQPVQRRSGGGRRADGAGVAGDSARDEAIPVAAVAAEALDLDMNRMRE